MVLRDSHPPPKPAESLPPPLPQANPPPRRPRELFRRFAGPGPQTPPNPPPPLFHKQSPVGVDAESFSADRLVRQLHADPFAFEPEITFPALGRKGKSLFRKIPIAPIQVLNQLAGKSGAINGFPGQHPQRRCPFP